MHSHLSQHNGKSISSQQDTRNPTTNKKVIFYTPIMKPSQKRYYTPNRGRQNKLLFEHQKLKQKSDNLHKSMYQLSSKKQQCLRSSRYQQAKHINTQLQRLQRKRAKTQAKRLLTQHKYEKKVIKKAHKKEISKFEQAWQNYFIGLKAKQQITLIHFKKVQQRDIRFVQQQLVDKCKTLKVSTGELKSLQKTEKKLQKQERFEQLMEIKKHQRHLKQKLLLDQQERIYSWAKREEDALKSYHTKKYNALINRIEEMHNDKYRQYQREGHRLRLKYHNVLRKLEHQQKVEVNYLLDKFPQAKDVVKGRSFTMSV